MSKTMYYIFHEAVLLLKYTHGLLEIRSYILETRCLYLNSEFTIDQQCYSGQEMVSPCASVSFCVEGDNDNSYFIGTTIMIN